MPRESDVAALLEFWRSPEEPELREWKDMLGSGEGEVEEDECGKASLPWLLV